MPTCIAQIQFVTFLVAGGTGLVIINNIAQINSARGGDPKLKVISHSVCEAHGSKYDCKLYLPRESDRVW